MKRRVFYFLIALIVPLIVQADDVAPIMTNTIENIATCKREHNATRNDYDALRKSSVPQSRPGQCFMACIFERFYVIQSGKYATDSFVKLVTALYRDDPQKRSKAIDMVQDCGKLADQWSGFDDRCDYSVKVMECIASYSSQVPVVKDFLKYQKGKKA